MMSGMAGQRTPEWNPSSLAQGSNDSPLASQVREFLVGLLPRTAPVERRNNGRFPFPSLLKMTPVDDQTLTPLEEPLVVVGKELSERGLGFFHQFPLAYRRVIVTLENPDGRKVSLLMDLSWCRFTSQGWYESGGRFLELVAEQNAV
jgi:hypothetical protein